VNPDGPSSDALQPRPLVLPALAGHAVTLRAFRASDVDVVREAARDPLIPLITSIPAAADHEQALAFIERQQERLRERAGYSFAIADDAGMAVGQIGLWLRDAQSGRASVGYWVAPSARGRGFAAAALCVLVGWARTLPGLRRIELSVEPWNEASWRTAERAGFERESLQRSRQVIDGTPRDMFMYALLLAPRRVL
jgi:RimJ/RimL family protein N-acetyltransferase